MSRTDKHSSLVLEDIMIIYIYIRAVQIEEIHGSACDACRRETNPPLRGQQEGKVLEAQGNLIWAEAIGSSSETEQLLSEHRQSCN